MLKRVSFGHFTKNSKGGDDVSFGYEGDKQEGLAEIVLKKLNFAIPERKTAAIVGPSGSRKTTLRRRIARFYDVSQGSITVVGIKVRKFTCDSLLKNISMVF